jgi:hypothetical protein
MPRWLGQLDRRTAAHKTDMAFPRSGASLKRHHRERFASRLLNAADGALLDETGAKEIDWAELDAAPAGRFQPLMT